VPAGSATRAGRTRLVRRHLRPVGVGPPACGQPEVGISAAERLEPAHRGSQTSHGTTIPPRTSGAHTADPCRGFGPPPTAGSQAEPAMTCARPGDVPALGGQGLRHASARPSPGLVGLAGLHSRAARSNPGTGGRGRRAAAGWQRRDLGIHEVVRGHLVGGTDRRDLCGLRGSRVRPCGVTPRRTVFSRPRGPTRAPASPARAARRWRLLGPLENLLPTSWARRRARGRRAQPPSSRSTSARSPGPMASSPKATSTRSSRRSTTRR
jgi:hypothetical protein